MCKKFDEELNYYSLGVNYKYGFNGYPVDLEKAREYLEIAAENNAEAAAIMAFFYLDEGLSKDTFIEDNPEKYLMWMKKAAELGHKTVTKLLPRLE